MKMTTAGIDLVKNVLQVHGVDEVFRKLGGARDRAQLVIEYSGEREQIVALVL